MLLFQFSVSTIKLFRKLSSFSPSTQFFPMDTYYDFPHLHTKRNLPWVYFVSMVSHISFSSSPQSCKNHLDSAFFLLVPSCSLASSLFQHTVEPCPQQSTSRTQTEMLLNLGDHFPSYLMHLQRSSVWNGLSIWFQDPMPTHISSWVSFYPFLLSSANTFSLSCLLISMCCRVQYLGVNFVHK